jgi:hypothetical protein
MLRKRLKQSLYFGSAVAMAALVAVTVAAAGNDGQQLTTSPFITAESAQTKEFHAVAFHKGRRNPYLFSTNNSNPAYGSYGGVLLNCNGEPGFGAFDTLSFAYKGPKDARTFVIFKPRIGPFLTRSLTLDQGVPGMTGKDGFSDVSFSKDQFGITPGSFIRDIVIVPPPSKEAGRFLIDDIRVDKQPVKKVLATKFLDSLKAPVGGAFSFAAAAAPPSNSPTAVVVRNSSNASVEVWVTLGAGTSFTQVNQVFPQSGPGDPQWANGGTGSEDHLTLAAPSGGTPSIIRSVNNLGTVNGRTFFGKAGDTNDPTGGGGCPTREYPCGATLAEWSLNPANIVSQGEACNISLNNGMNANIQMVYAYNNGFDWNDGPEKGGKLNIVKVAETKTPLSSNANNDGVYPFNCPCCTAPVCGNANCGYIFPVAGCKTSSLSACWNKPDWKVPVQPATKPSSRALCQVQRNNGTGGAVHIVFNGFTLPKDCN